MPGTLLYYPLVLIAVAIVAALLGFGGVASTAMSGANLIVWVAVVILIVGVVFDGARHFRRARILRTAPSVSLVGKDDFDRGTGQSERQA